MEARVQSVSDLAMRVAQDPALAARIKESPAEAIAILRLRSGGSAAPIRCLDLSPTSLERLVDVGDLSDGGENERQK